MSVAVQNVQDMENIVKDPNKNGINGSLHNNGNDPYKHFVSLSFFVLHNIKVTSLIHRTPDVTVQLLPLFSFLPESSELAPGPLFIVPTQPPIHPPTVGHLSFFCLFY